MEAPEPDLPDVPAPSSPVRLKTPVLVSFDSRAVGLEDPDCPSRIARLDKVVVTSEVAPAFWVEGVLDLEVVGPKSINFKTGSGLICSTFAVSNWPGFRFWADPNKTGFP
ncbi:hypothetical protein LQ236_002444 [Nitrospina gracilis]|uniref:hypothetical protein n=1 Tax=Nitrospina TaxID=35800 RepID=UPI0005A8D37A|nr:MULTISPECIES: hypothetical protein [Nitrospina]MCF8724424.1 hypothetical protein [Nitrospina sp. Nb-3]